MKFLYLLSLLIIISCSAPVKKKEHRLISVKVTGMKDQWYSCKLDSECTLIQEKECKHYIAINRKYRSEVLEFIEKKGLPFECRKKIWRQRPEVLCDLVTDSCKMDDGHLIY